MNEPEPLQQVRRTYVRFQGRVLSYFAGCDYFRLASHPQVTAAVTEGLQRFGLNVAASRLTTGNHVVYGALERLLAGFFGTETAVLVNSGYATNLIVAQALAGKYSHALIDELAHLSLVDATSFLNCPVLRFKHRDISSLAMTLKRCGEGIRPLLLTDGMFSRDGSVAPLRAYLKLLPRDGLILVDDAHGAGILGVQGRGAVEIEGVARGRLVQSVTLSKAFGVYGGAIVCSKRMRSQILERSPMFCGTTPLPLPLAHAAAAAVRLVGADRSLRNRLHTNADYIKNALRSAGMTLPETPGPIIRFPLPDKRQNTVLRRALLESGIYPSFTQYHRDPSGGYFRFVISSEHTSKQLQQLATVLARFVP